MGSSQNTSVGDCLGHGRRAQAPSSTGRMHTACDNPLPYKKKNKRGSIQTEKEL